MQKELIYEIIMPNFPRQVKLSDSRRAKYFKPTDKLAMKYLSKNINIGPGVETGFNSKGERYALNNEFYWKEYKKANKIIELRLADKFSKGEVIKNSRVAGTERWEIINGQKFYNGKYNDFTAGKIMNAIHDYMTPFLQGLTPITEYPLIIDGFMYDYGKEDIISRGKMWDVGNRTFPYNKAFEDVLQQCGVIKQDDFEHIIGPPRLIFKNLEKEPNFISNSNVRCLVYQIYKICQ